MMEQSISTYTGAILLKKLVKISKTNCSNNSIYNENPIDLVSIAFNNPEVISQQIRLIKKYFADPYLYTVADNSKYFSARQKIYRLCKEQKINYIRIPRNSHNNAIGSESQGFAMNWIMKNFILPRQSNYFGFLDHDIFPIRSAKVISILDQQNIFGHIQTRDNKWYLWAGFCFYKREFTFDKELDFLPGNGLDTGGNNWGHLYQYIDHKKLITPSHKYGHLRDGDCPQSDWYEEIGDWIHTFNASGWMKVNNKTELINDLVNLY